MQTGKQAEIIRKALDNPDFIKNITCLKICLIQAKGVFMDFFNDLKEIIAIKSVLEAPPEGVKNAPFGAGNRAALDWFLKKAKAFGLKTGEVDGYAGWAEYGEGDECIGALCHLDVVPAGESWTYPPFELTEKNGRLYGRGVVDNKGAVVMCLHALKEIKAAKTKTNRRIRIIVGLNEEHGSACINHYVGHIENGGIPKMSFIPDAGFPVINSEKGILHLQVTIPLDSFFKKNIAYIEGGASINVVPDGATVSIFKDSPIGGIIEKLAQESAGGIIDNKLFSSPALAGEILASGASPNDYSIKTEADVYTITTAGTAGHAMAPDQADNAIWKIITALGALGGASSSPVVDFLTTYICNAKATSKLGIYKSDEASGDVTLNAGIIEFDGDSNLRFTMDVRLCVSANVDEVKANIEKALPKGGRMEVLRFSPNLYVSKDDPLVKTLLAVYKDKTGEDGYCVQTGGGTYARALLPAVAVAFGPTFDGKDSNLHKPDEYTDVDDFKKCAEIYKEAMIRLANC